MNFDFLIKIQNLLSSFDSFFPYNLLQKMQKCAIITFTNCMIPQKQAKVHSKIMPNSFAILT